jgi:hypothetical protein
MTSSVLPVLATSLQVALPSQATWESGLTLALNKRSILSSVLGVQQSWDRQLTQIYEEADLNRDGSISFDECYERLLRFYIKLNQQAPIPPPDRTTVLDLYTEYDWNRNHKLSCDEFKQLAKVLASTALTRLAAHKTVTIVVAPLIATTLVHALATSSLLASPRSVSSSVVQAMVPTHLAESLLSPNFWKTVVMIFTISQLGNIVLNLVNAYLCNTPHKGIKKRNTK